MSSRQVIPLNPTRKYLLYNMKPKLVPPQSSVSIWADMSAANNFRSQFDGPIRLTYTHLFVKAVAIALDEQPEVNAVWIAKGILLLGDIRIGVPIPVKGGTIAVTIENPQFKSLHLIAQELAEGAEDSRSRPLQSGILVRLPQAIATLALNYFKHYPPPVIRRSFTFQISNFGQWGIDRTVPALTRTAMVTPGRVADRVVALDGVLGVRTTCSLAFAYDCRVIDDIQASRFLDRLKDLLENPQDLS